MQAVIQRIQERLEDLSHAQRVIAEFIEREAHDAAFMTAAELGQATQVSESTVVRFATALGYSGYPDLRRALQDDLRSRLSAKERLKVSLEQGDEADTILNKVLRRDVENIQTTLETLSDDTFLQVVEQITQSQQTLIIGVRSARALADYLGFYLDLILRNVKTVNGYGSFFESLSTVGHGDTVIAISFPRYARLTVDAFEYAAAQGATTIAITDRITSPVAEHAALTLTAESTSASFADSLVAPLSVINALIAAIALNNQNQVTALLDDLESVWHQYDIYLGESDNL